MPGGCPETYRAATETVYSPVLQGRHHIRLSAAGCWSRADGVLQGHLIQAGEHGGELLPQAAHVLRRQLTCVRPGAMENHSMNANQDIGIIQESS